MTRLRESEKDLGRRLELTLRKEFGEDLSVA